MNAFVCLLACNVKQIASFQKEVVHDFCVDIVVGRVVYHALMSH